MLMINFRRRTQVDYIESKKVSLKTHQEFNEKWLQEKIEENPEILGLGENVELVGSERRQSSSGRLDLLLQDSDADKRYTVELQLGKCDESHIIRTIEYWDLERKRYPDREHYAVIVAEDITSRFWNVINLFNRSIPLIAIQLEARKIENKITLNFIKVLDSIKYGDEDGDGYSEPTDRKYWEKRSNLEMLSLVDSMKTSLEKFFPNIELNYNKYYIGLKRDGVSDNFISFRPFKQFTDIRILKTSLNKATIHHLEHEHSLTFDWKDRSNYNQYRIRISNKKFLEEKRSAIEILFKEAGGYKQPITTEEAA